MKVNILTIVVLLISCFGALAQGQGQFAGKYDLIAGVTTGDAAGLFSYGAATVKSNGRAAYTVYWPFLGTSGSGSGVISRKGVFAFNDGTEGSARFYGKRVAVGTYSQSYGTGFFALRKR